MAKSLSRYEFNKLAEIAEFLYGLQSIHDDYTLNCASYTDGDAHTLIEELSSAEMSIRTIISDFANRL